MIPLNFSKKKVANKKEKALDTKTSAEIMELFKPLNESGRTVVIVTHDITNVI